MRYGNTTRDPLGFRNAAGDTMRVTRGGLVELSAADLELPGVKALVDSGTLKTAERKAPEPVAEPVPEPAPQPEQASPKGRIRKERGRKKSAGKGDGDDVETPAPDADERPATPERKAALPSAD